MSFSLNTTILNNTKSGYLFDGIRVKGAYSVVLTYADLADFPREALMEGTHVFVVSEGKSYYYVNDTWKPVEFVFSSTTNVLVEYNEETGQYVISRAASLFLDYPYDYSYDYTSV